ncbi:2'-5' RNA ligase [Stutzerimonas stutzeri TS44]|nr:2'-5' RNA ligase [Stutzerimonas stutzeri TS44]
MSAGGSLRLFFALPCPPAQAAAICTWRDGLALDGRPVPAQNLHLTLAFLGAQPTSRLEELTRLAAGLDCPAFALRLDRLATIGKGFICLLPSAAPPALDYLVAALRAQLATQGLVPDSRPFLPHLTLTRHAHERAHGHSPAFAWTVDRFVLFVSETTAQGARYRELGSWPLRESGTTDMAAPDRG